MAVNRNRGTVPLSCSCPDLEKEMEMKTKIKKLQEICRKKNVLPALAVFCLCSLILCSSSCPVSAMDTLLPNVTEAMTDPAYWADEEGEVLTDPDALQYLNRSFFQVSECWMKDLRNAGDEFDEEEFFEEILGYAEEDLEEYTNGEYWDREGNTVTEDTLSYALYNTGGEDASGWKAYRYGICVRHADLMTLPDDLLITDEKGDLDYNAVQVSALRVGEPVLVKEDSVEGDYLYVDTDCISGWVRTEAVALCRNREEWLSAWDFPEEEAVVVEEGRLVLEESNVNPSASGVQLDMGTILRKVRPEEYDVAMTGRTPIHNIPVWLPVRRPDGSYTRTIALISRKYDVSEGFLPLTAYNIVKTAFARLGDVYGWGSMLNSADCSNYLRDIYRCFGLNMPRNTVRQMAMPVYKIDVSGMSNDEKKEVLDTLPTGACLYVPGHTMLYLGRDGGKYFVISASSRMTRIHGDEKTRIRGVVINSLGVGRPNGKTWLSLMNTVLVPWMGEDEEISHSDITLELLP